MKRCFLLCLTIAFMSNVESQIISVSKDAALKPNYSEIQDAVNNAPNGSVIYVYPGVYSGFTIKKKQLALIGPGYFLGENPQTQANIAPATIIGEVLLDTLSDGSMLQGLNIESRIIASACNGAIIKSNRVKSVFVTGANSIIIKKNFIYEQTQPAGSGYIMNVYVTNNSTNITLANNFIIGANLAWNLYYGGYYGAFWCDGNSSLSVVNNVISGNIGGINLICQNNIYLMGSNLSCTSCSYANNFSYSDQAFGLTNGNDTISNIAAEFNTSITSTDGQWQLKSTSRLKGKGTNGTDPGMFGGDDPYRLSGIPDIPTIYYFKSSDGGTTQQGLPVHIKVKSH